ncbi:MAG: DUF2797 domain-containing protein [Flavobacterium sp.]|jgi:hypothetical protein
MIFEGVITKMQTEYTSPIQYFLTNQTSFVHVNQLIGKTINIEHIGYECLNCGKSKKIYRQGNCYDCLMSNAAVGDWIMKPELSTAHLGIEDRDLEYEKKIQLQPHIVYLAYTGDIKVGVTRSSQVPTRWIDQGATAAISILEVPNRFLAGKCEVLLKNYYKDKTDFRKMLSNKSSPINLIEERNKIEKYLDFELKEYFKSHKIIELKINYPIDVEINKVKTIKIENNCILNKKLIGIKGQYLVFEDSSVLNIRNQEGFKIKIT